MRLIPVLISLCLLCTGCLLSDNAEQSADDLYGEWYRLDSTGTRNPSPAAYVNGFSIYADKNAQIGMIHPLGIEGQSGSLALLDGIKYMPRIEQEFDQQLVIWVAAVPVFTWDTVSYRFESDKLLLDGTYFDGTYKRSELGNEVVSPTQSELSVVIDGQRATNKKVVRRPPSAYISKISYSEIQLQAEVDTRLDDNIYITINNFHGPGTYTISKGEAEITGSVGDAAVSYSTKLDSAGYITIKTFNSKVNRCTGSFHFIADDGDQGEERDERRITEGTFDLPVFK